MSIQVCVTGLVAYLSQKLGVTFYLLGILLCLMVIDYLSGMAASAVEALDHPDDKSYGWSSRKGAKGIAKKVAYLFVIAVGMVIDYVIIQTSGVLGFNLPNTMLSLLVYRSMNGAIRFGVILTLPRFKLWECQPPTLPLTRKCSEETGAIKGAIKFIK